MLIPSIQSLLSKIGDNSKFSSDDYYVAGAFVYFIIYRYGIDIFKSFYSLSFSDDIALIRTFFRQTYTVDIDSVVGEFVSYCSHEN
jgi:hypothetical protein